MIVLKPMSRFLIPSIAVSLYATSAFAQTSISPDVQQQIAGILAAKTTMSPAQQKMSSDLAFATMGNQNIVPAGVNPIPATVSTVTVDITATVTPDLLNLIGNSGGIVINSFPAYNAIRATLPLASVSAVANSTDVSFVRAADQYYTNVGSVTSQGYVAHKANSVIGMGINGTGVKVGVLSDTAYAAEVAALIASGDLPASTTVLPGQDGSAFTTSGTNEGTAMMEIVHDLAPGAQLFFATADGGQANFANNIVNLRNVYNCDIIVDDVTYFAEGAFQDGTVAKAVSTVTAAGALYFSAAANSGNLTSGTSGTWEGDFVSAGPVAGPIATAGETGLLHSFGANAYDVLTGTTSVINLKWSDPLAGSCNDYDLFILNSTGTVLKGFSATSQTCTQDPFEQIGQGSNCGTATASGYCPAVGDRIVVVLFNGSARALRIDTNRGILSVGTSGSTFGHNAAGSTVTMAATAWNSAHKGTTAFTGFANRIETFSSDGPRKIFYTPTGTAITPGNVLFGTNGGTTLSKPDLTAADGVFAKTPGFLPFFGTSAASPHAAGVAALVKSANPALTNAQILTILKATALDTMAVGIDRDSGSGIVMALPAVQSALGH